MGINGRNEVGRPYAVGARYAPAGRIMENLNTDLPYQISGAGIRNPMRLLMIND